MTDQRQKTLYQYQLKAVRASIGEFIIPISDISAINNKIVDDVANNITTPSTNGNIKYYYDINEDTKILDSNNNNSKTYYFTDKINNTNNGSYKIGVALAWGGAISYIEDLNDGDNNLNSLINNKDVGRLLQQSYYGTRGCKIEESDSNYNEYAQYTNDTEDVYYCGKTTASRWNYNPVQGGNYGNNLEGADHKESYGSRLIDVKLIDNGIYIKAQPQDWAKENAMTPSYMENKYTIISNGETDKIIQVDNSFINFSDWDNEVMKHELPSLYTVSSLSRFYWYDGIKPWMDDDENIIYDDNLPTWSDEKNYYTCEKYLKTGNTETWCAWTNPNNQFGIGLYVPNVDYFIAGKTNYNKNNPTNEANANSTNYVGAKKWIKIVSYKPINYSYFIKTGNVGTIRNAFKAKHNQNNCPDNASLYTDCVPRKVYGDNFTNDNNLLNIDFDCAEKIDMISPFVQQYVSTSNSTGYTNPDFKDSLNDLVISYEHDENVGYAKITATPQSYETEHVFDPYVYFRYYRDSQHKVDRFNKLTIEYKIPKSSPKESYKATIGIYIKEKGTATITKELTKADKFSLIEIRAEDIKKDINNDTIKIDDMDEITMVRLGIKGCSDGDAIYLKSIQITQNPYSQQESEQPENPKEQEQSTKPELNIIKKYDFSDKNKTHIINIKPSTNIKDFLGNLDIKGEIVMKRKSKILDISNGKDKTTTIATGDKIEVTLNQETMTYTAIVIGDLNGDGEMSDSDLMKLARYRAKLDTNLAEAYLEAADIHKDGELAQDSDLIKMARILVKLDNL